MNETQKNKTSVNEFLKMLAQKRATEKQTQDEQDGLIVEPIICNGVENIVVHNTEDKEM